MSDKKISQLTTATTPLAGTEVLPIVQSGVTKQVSVTNLTAGRPTFTGLLTVTAATSGNAVELLGRASDEYAWVVYKNTAGTVVNAEFGINNGKIFYGYVNGTELYTLNGVTGNVKVSTGNLVIGTAGKGIDFPDVDITTNGSGTTVISGATQTDGLVSHAGTGGAYNSNKFNLQWTGSPILWVDAVNLGTISLTSDYRVKKSVKTQTEKAIPKIMKLRPVTYEFKDYGNLFVADGIKREGFIAHEVQEVIPSGAEGVKDAKDRIQNLRTDAILSVAVKAIQEQQLQIEQLIAEIATLKGAV